MSSSSSYATEPMKASTSGGEQRRIRFKYIDMLFLLLNIIAHDVIHDYGNTAAIARWKRNQKLVAQFTPNVQTMSDKVDDVMVGDDDDDDDDDTGDDGSMTDGGNPYKKKGKLFLQSLTIPQKIELHKEFPWFSASMKLSPADISRAIQYIEKKKSRQRARSLQLNKARQIIVDSKPHSFTVPDKKLLPRKSRYKKPFSKKPFSKKPFSKKFTIRRTKVSTVVTEEEYMYALKYIKQDINIKIIFTFFQHFLENYNDEEQSMIILHSEYYFIDCMNSFDLIIPEVLQGYPTFINGIFNEIITKFIKDCSRKGFKFLKYDVYLEKLCEFLSSYNEQDIIPKYISPVKKNAWKGGGNILKTSITYLEAIDLLRKIGELNAINKVQFEQLDDNETSEGEYVNIQESLENQYNVELKGLTKKENPFSRLISQSIRSSSRTNISRAKRFLDQIELVEKDCREIIEKERKKQAKLKKEQERLETSGLTREDLDVRSNFQEFIAKSGLFLTGVCNRNGVINPKLSELEHHNPLRKQTDILLYIAGWQEEAKKVSPKWGKVTNASLDTELLKYFAGPFAFNFPGQNIYITEEGSTRYFPTITTHPFYNVDNSSMIPATSRTAHTFCPYTSIFDGMPQCSWNSSDGLREGGNMNFLLISDDETLYYNGQLELTSLENATSHFTIGLPGGISLSGTKQLHVIGKNLEAHRVLKETLLKLIRFIISQEPGIRDIIFSRGNVLKNLFTFFSDPSNPDNIRLFQEIFSELLFKCTGDLYQEITAICRYGGYTGEKYFKVPRIYPFNEHGLAVRFLTANDRPSSFRAAFMLLKGNEEDVNTQAYCGYFSKERQVLVKHPQNTLFHIPSSSSTSKRPSKRGGGAKLIEYKKNNKTRKIRKKIS